MASNETEGTDDLTTPSEPLPWKRDTSEADRAREADPISRAFRFTDRVFGHVRRSWIVRHSPMLIANSLMYVDHLLHILDQHREEKLGREPFATDLDSFHVDPDEHVTVPAILMIEVFPPSEIASLRRSLKKNDVDAAQLRFYPYMTTRLDEARAGSVKRSTWWRLGTVVRRNSGIFATDPIYGKLPHGISEVELKAIQIGESITMLLACFRLNEQKSRKLDTVWHKDFQPKIRWGKRGQYPQAIGPKWAAFKEVQEARAVLHAETRHWLADFSPGVFAANDEPQPLIDLLIFDKLDGTLDVPPASGTHDLIRALGLPHTHDIINSRQMPGFVFAPMDARNDSEVDETRTWALWGQRKAVTDALATYLKGHGLSDDDWGITYFVQHAIEDYFTRTALTELLSTYRVKYAGVRDTARDQHGKFSKKELKRLRSNLLSLSVDLTGVGNDIRQYNSHGWRVDHAKFFYRDSPWAEKRSNEAGFPATEAINMNRRMVHDQIAQLDTLSAVDREYREILTAAASLSASLQSQRTGVLALFVALVSLGIAAATLVLADAPNDNLLEMIVSWFSAKFLNAD